MKTNIFKTVLPALAILLAMSLSFAVELERVNQTGYFDDPLEEGIQQEITDCEPNLNTEQCKSVAGFQLYASDELDAIPNNELRKVNQ
jgi:Family of unknown function (DUF6520)